MDIKGKVHEVSPTIQATESLKKRELIIEYADNPQYQEYIKFEAINDRCALIDNLKPGQDVEVFFNLKGKPYTDKAGKKSYFNSLQVWKVNILSGTPEYGAPSFVPADDDDLPF